MKKNIVKYTSFLFAIRIVTVYQHLEDIRKEFARKTIT